MASITIDCEISLSLSGDVPEWARERVLEVADEVSARESERVRREFEKALADEFGAGVLGDQSDA